MPDTRQGEYFVFAAECLLNGKQPDYCPGSLQYDPCLDCEHCELTVADDVYVFTLDEETSKEVQ